MHKQDTPKQHTTVLPYEKKFGLKDQISKDGPCRMPTLLGESAARKLIHLYSLSVHLSTIYRSYVSQIDHLLFHPNLFSCSFIMSNSIYQAILKCVHRAKDQFLN